MWAMSVGAQERAAQFVSNGWATLGPDQDGRVCASLEGKGAGRAKARVWLYLSRGKEGAGTACQPRDSDAVPDGHLGKAVFCIRGRDAHRVIGKVDSTGMAYEMFTDAQAGNKARTCSDLGDCYELREFYEIDLRTNYTVPC
eukprot:evm.model.scf_257.1 EVM.evm.TU.scf_257.1   scf_257:27387-28597(+)